MLASATRLGLDNQRICVIIHCRGDAMTRPIEYPLHISGYTPMESGRAYVAARFALDMMQMLLPYKDSLSSWTPAAVVDNYWRVCKVVSLTELFARSDRSHFSRTTHNVYFTNTGICNKKSVTNLTAYLAAEIWRKDFDVMLAAYGVDRVQPILEVSGAALAKTYIKLQSTEVLVDILNPTRRGYPDVRSTSRVDIELVTFNLS